MARYTTDIKALQEAIDILGGVGALASKCSISYQSIIDWRKGKKSPSPESCQKIEKATEEKVTRQELLPDYPWGN